MLGIVLGFGNGAALEPGFRRTGLPIPGGDGDEFHHVKGNVFVAPHDRVTDPVFLHKCWPPAAPPLRNRTSVFIGCTFTSTSSCRISTNSSPAGWRPRGISVW